ERAEGLGNNTHLRRWPWLRGAARQARRPADGLRVRGPRRRLGLHGRHHRACQPTRRRRPLHTAGDVRSRCGPKPGSLPGRRQVRRLYSAGRPAGGRWLAGGHGRGPRTGRRGSRSVRATDPAPPHKPAGSRPCQRLAHRPRTQGAVRRPPLPRPPPGGPALARHLRQRQLLRAPLRMGEHPLREDALRRGSPVGQERCREGPQARLRAPIRRPPLPRTRRPLRPQAPLRGGPPPHGPLRPRPDAEPRPAAAERAPHDGPPLPPPPPGGQGGDLASRLPAARRQVRHLRPDWRLPGGSPTSEEGGVRSLRQAPPVSQPGRL
ncbi:MAG: Rhamnosyltransferase, partial [uncultured Rubrobacteraceae bacterium]